MGDIICQNNSPVDKEELSSRNQNIQRSFCLSEVTSLSFFKAELLSHCSSTVVSTFILCEIHISNFVT